MHRSAPATRLSLRHARSSCQSMGRRAAVPHRHRLQIRQPCELCFPASCDLCVFGCMARRIPARASVRSASGGRPARVVAAWPSRIVPHNHARTGTMPGDIALSHSSLAGSQPGHLSRVLAGRVVSTDDARGPSCLAWNLCWSTHLCLRRIHTYNTTEKV
jgi:hypothetical protein